ncbi:nitroreductase family protein [Candidatus Sumerlaeota bacterium]|nr:nitroreductase family protein [Candidatus Sumerlaeota bacterium]
MIKELILKNRSYRRFQQNSLITRDVLEELVDLGRISASAANLQPLKYMLFNDPENAAAIFPHLAWAGYLKDWGGPKQGERPSAYIIMLCDKNIAPGVGCDHGIAAQSILLGASEKGLGGCMIGSIDRQGLRETLDISERYDIVLVLALGRPDEKVVLETATSPDNVKYWRDAEGVHHVPKRPLKEIIIN